MKSLFLAGIFILSIALLSCGGEKDCPDGMEDCQVDSDTSVCVPEGKC